LPPGRDGSLAAICLVIIRDSSASFIMPRLPFFTVIHLFDKQALSRLELRHDYRSYPSAPSIPVASHETHTFSNLIRSPSEIIAIEEKTALLFQFRSGFLLLLVVTVDFSFHMP
jgi:hypothetical protein